MAVRVRVEIRNASGDFVQTVAVLNGGFEVSEPHILLPPRVVAAVFPEFMTASSDQQMSAAGADVHFRILRETAQVRVITHGRMGESAKFRILASLRDEEPLISDMGIDALGIRIEKFNPGLWRFQDDTTINQSEKAENW